MAKTAKFTDFKHFYSISVKFSMNLLAKNDKKHSERKELVVQKASSKK